MGSNAIISYASYKYNASAIVLLACNAKGVCSISLGDYLEPLLVRLQQDFVGVTLVNDVPGLQEYLIKIVAYLTQQNSQIKIPLDIQGSAFQLRVWQALRQIPLGQTISYATLANNIKSPKAIRAVANACASNKLALAIPCHRVISSSGSLAGYRWGLKYKQSLLELEGAYKNLSLNY